MAKKLQKLTAAFLTVVMCMTSFCTTAFAEEPAGAGFANQVGDYLEYDSNGDSGDYTDVTLKTIEDGKVTLSKTIEQTGKDAFDITLQVTTTEDLEVIKKARDAAIVIVMDVSGSMQFDMSGGGYCTKCGKYKTDAYSICSANGVICDRSGWSNTWAQHDSLTALDVTPEHGDTRFTLMENAVSAFLEDFADNSGSNAKRMVSLVCYNDKVEKELGWVNVTDAEGLSAAQAVVAPGALADLTGGDTNTSLGLQRANEYLDADAIKGIENTYVLLLTDGAPYTAIQYNSDGTYNPRVSGVGYDCDLTQVAADKLKADHEDTEVYTVCFGYQGKEWTATHSIVDGKLTGTDKKFNIDELMAAIASEGCFFRGEDVDEFDLSLGSIVEETISHGAKLWTVTDPMGDYIVYKGLKEANPAAAYGEGTLSWDLLAEKPVSVENGVYTYALTYSVILKSGADGFVYGKYYPANKATSLEYALTENGEMAGGVKTDYFNVPTVFAESDGTNPPSIGSKTAERIDGEPNKYWVEIEVPGDDGDTRHDEVILMVDGSYSMDNEWPAMKDAINTIGRTVLNGSGTTQLTLMAFGMGDNIVLEHVKDADALADALGALPGNLLYGRSSTNCEAGFTGVANYINNHDETLKDVHVIFISDGNINTDETPRAFDANWQTWTKFGALFVARAAFEETVSYGENLPAAFTAVFGDRFDGATREEIMDRAFGGEVTDEEFIAFAEQLWTDVYAYSGLTRGEEYPVSAAERAFVKYDKEKGTYIQDLFYYTTYKSAYVTYGDRWTRTPAAADALAAMDEVSAMYVVDYDSYTSWMDTGITSEKSTFVQSNGIAGLCEALQGALTDLSKTPFNDVVVTDYMSKWVNLDPSTLKVIDNRTGKEIWSAAAGWLIDENRPTAQEVPVVAELVDPADYEAGGGDVAGNTSGDIYKLTWYVKDGALLRSDTYTLQYEVTVDTEEIGFEYDYDYPANGNTDLHYIDEDGFRQTDPIVVPDVYAPAEEYKVSFPAGGASHICYLFVNKETGEVTYEYKIDFDDGDTTADPIQVKDGFISVVFIKQAQSGMIWTSEKVSDEILDDIIASVKKNDKAYKGHDAVAFGEGEHNLTYAIGNGKKAKNNTVTYTFIAE